MFQIQRLLVRKSSLPRPLDQIAVLVLFCVVIALPNLATAQDCLPSDQAAYAMVEFQYDAGSDGTVMPDRAWYSADDAGQVELILQHLSEAGVGIPDMPTTQVHIMHAYQNASVVLYGNAEQICGFTNVVMAPTSITRAAIASALQQQTAEHNQTGKEGVPLADHDAALSEAGDLLFGSLVLVAREDLRLRHPELCVALDPMAIHEIEQSGSFNGHAAQVHEIYLRASSSPSTRFIRNAVGDERASEFGYAHYLLMVEDDRHYLTFVVAWDIACSLAPRFPIEVVDQWMAVNEPDCTIEPGDPICMSPEQRESWRMLQGLIQGEDPVSGIRSLMMGE